MENSWGEELFAQYGNMCVYEDAEELGEGILQIYGAYIDSCDEFEIVLKLLDRPYLTEDEIEERKKEYQNECEDWDVTPEEFFCEEMQWSVTCTCTIELDEGVIAGITVEDSIWGGDALGDFEPSEVYTEKELTDMEHAVHGFFSAVTYPNSEEDDEV